MAMVVRTLWKQARRRSIRGVANTAREAPSVCFPEVVIVAAKRTPVGSFQGSLASLSAPELGSIAIRGALDSVKLSPEHVNEVFMGNVLSAGVGQAPARQAALKSGLLPSTICTTVNKVCASGMKAVMLGAQSIMLGVNQVVVAGGMESMSNAPFILPRNVSPKIVGHVQLRDSMIVDGLWDPYKDVSMGSCAEDCAYELSISRDAQDEHAIASYERAAAAQALGVTKGEIVPVTIEGKKPVTVSHDEECLKFDPEKLKKLRPVFKEDGTITAGNSSTLSDGAAVLLLTSAAFADEHKLKVLGRIRGFGDAAQAPEKFPTSPALAIPIALEHAGLTKENVDLYEINEAFSASYSTLILTNHHKFVIISKNKFNHRPKHKAL
ncbi:hypothetical protein M758_9G158300 [Ceratodon purpureus]|nr:hypothetical protein M758_9G158300 [Ceratodon purpureus]